MRTCPCNQGIIVPPPLAQTTHFHHFWSVFFTEPQDLKLLSLGVAQYFIFLRQLTALFLVLSVCAAPVMAAMISGNFYADNGLRFFSPRGNFPSWETTTLGSFGPTYGITCGGPRCPCSALSCSLTAPLKPPRDGLVIADEATFLPRTQDGQLHHPSQEQPDGAAGCRRQPSDPHHRRRAQRTLPKPHNTSPHRVYLGPTRSQHENAHACPRVRRREVR